MALTVNETTQMVIKVINEHRSDDLGNITGVKSPVNINAIMYSYGSTDEFINMVAELEEEYGIELDDEIGELTVKELIDHVVSLV